MLCLTSNHTAIPALFNALYTNDIPARFTFRFLQSLGFKSSKMRDLVTFLHAFGFLNEDGSPTSSYMAFKKSTDPQSFVSVCATNVYRDFLPQIQDLSETSLMNVFASKYPDLDTGALTLAVKTFMAITDYSSFYQGTPLLTNGATFAKKDASKQSFNININLPETENERVYEAIFKYLKEILRQ